MSIPQMYLYNSFADWVTVTNSIANEVGDLAVFSGQNIGQTDIVHALNNLDVLKYDKVGGAISGFVTIGQTLAVTGTTTLTGLLTANNDIMLGTNAITLSSSLGNGTFAGALNVAGLTSLSVTSISSALTVTGWATFNSNVTLVGNVLPGIDIFTITNTTNNTFTVDSATGNTLVAGTLGISGAVALSNTLSVQSDFSINTNSFNVAAASGNTSIAGTLHVNGITTLTNSMLSTLGVVTTNSPVMSATQTWNNSGATFNGLVVNITNIASSPGSLLLAFQQSGLTTFGVTTGGTINQQTTTSNLARTIISTLSEFRTIREYQDLNDGLSGGTQGLDVNSVSNWSNTFNARWDAASSLYIKDRSNNATGLDHAYISRFTEDFKQQWWFSDGSTAGSAISWVKRIEFDMFASSYTFNGSLTTGTLNTSNLIAQGSFTLGSATSFSDFIVTTTSTVIRPLSTIDATKFRSATFDIQAYDAISGKYHKATISAIHNGTIVDYVEYGAVATVGICGTYTIILSGTSLMLNVVPVSTNSTVFKVHSTLIAV